MADYTDRVVAEFYVLGVFTALRTESQNILMQIYIFDKAKELSIKKKDIKEVRRYESIIKLLWGVTPLFDPPSNINSQQVIAIVEKYLNSHPEKWSDSADIIIRNSLCEAFPIKPLK